MDVPVLIDEPFKRFVRTKPCLFCGRPPGADGSDPHHVRNRARGEVHRYDHALVPACRDCHNRIGNLGTEKMLEVCGMRLVDLVLAVAMLLTEFYEERAAA